MNKQNNLINSEKKEELITYKKKDNYDVDTPEKNIIVSFLCSKNKENN